MQQKLSIFISLLHYLLNFFEQGSSLFSQLSFSLPSSHSHNPCTFYSSAQLGQREEKKLKLLRVVLEDRAFLSQFKAVWVL